VRISSVSELAATVRALVDQIAAGDRACKRFGAARHRWALRGPSTESLNADFESLPADYRAFVKEISGGGAGPYYGLIDVERAIRYPIDGAWGRGIPIADAGCGYGIVLAESGVWICARPIGVVRAIAPSFTAYYLDWLQRLARNDVPEPPVPSGQCALAGALGGYLGACEQRLGLALGTIAGDALRDALDALGPGAITIAADRAEPLFADGEPVDPCLACAILVENLGLSRDVVAPGLATKLER
jgi:hypothetical protein